MRYFILILSFLCLLACKSKEYLKIPLGTQTYILKIHSEYKILKFVDDHAYTEYHLVFPDSAIVYITNDNNLGGALNVFKAEKFGDGIYIKIATNDTLDISGSINGRFWRERKENMVVFGYINVPSESKEFYDKILSSLKRKKRN